MGRGPSLLLQMEDVLTLFPLAALSFLKNKGLQVFWDLWASVHLEYAKQAAYSLVVWENTATAFALKHQKKVLVTEKLIFEQFF